MVAHLQHYVIDWDKITTLNDLARIVAAMQVTFEPDCPTLDTIRDLVVCQDKPGYRSHFSGVA